MRFADAQAAIAERARDNPMVFGSAADAAGGAIILSAGGVLVRDGGGALLSAIGVSGATPDLDKDCAPAGIAAIEGDR